MPRSRKTIRVPVNGRDADETMSTTSRTSTTTQVPPHLRGQSSMSSAPPAKASSYGVPPHLRGPSSPPTASAGGPSSSIASGSREQAKAEKWARPANPDMPFACSFADCNAAFTSEAHLLKHKANPASGHDYCKICNLDFEDDDAYHAHKMENPEKHITCGVCSEDFRSEGGLIRHFAQLHAKEQDIRCRGCGKQFLKGAALMSHIEKNQCPNINKSDFETQRALVAITMDHLTNSNRLDTDLTAFTASTVGDSLEGGVLLEELTLLDDGDAPLSLGSAMPSSGSPSNVSSTSTSKANPVNNKLYESNYPTLGSQPPAKDIGKSKASGADENLAQKSWASHNFPGAPDTPAPPGWQPIPSSETGFLSTINTVNPLNGQISHFRLMDLKINPLDGQYHCPFLKCENGVYPTIELMQEHLNSGVHKGADHHCVGCLRRFKTPSALTAHMESPSARCHVRESRYFGNALSLVSGGYLGVNGRHSDGSIKIDSPEVPMPRW